MNNRLYLAVLALAMMLAVAAATVAKAAPFLAPIAVQEPLAPTAAERELYTRGQNLYLQGNYTQSAEVLISFLQTYPNSMIKDLALLWLGRAYYRVGKFVEAEEVGKRLRSIKDTPFAEIYDAELTTARREAAAQLSRTTAESSAQRAPQAATSQVTSTGGRSRYAEGVGEKPAASPALNPQRNAVTRQNSVALPRGRTRSIGRDTAGLPAKSGAGKSTGRSTTGTPPAKRGSASSTRSAAANAPQRSMKSASAISKPGAKVTSQSRQFPQKTVSKPKAAPVRSSAIAASHSAGARVPAVRKPAPVKGSSLPDRETTRNRPVRQSGVGLTVESAPGPAAVRPAADPNNFSNQSNGRSNSRVNERVATGGLYSLIEAAGEVAPGQSTLPARVDARSKRITAGPGEVVYLSFVVRNPESIKRTYELRISAPGAPEAKLFVDSNGDGIHQGDELPVTGAPVVELKNSEVPFLLEITIPRSAYEGQQYSYTVTVLSVGSGAVVATATSTLTVSSIRAQLLPARSRAGKSVLSLG